MPVMVPIMKSTKARKYWKSVEKRKHLYTVRDTNWYIHYGKQR
jgi:hypothetical protein